MAIIAHIEIRSGRLRLSPSSLLAPPFFTADVDEDVDDDFEEKD